MGDLLSGRVITQSLCIIVVLVVVLRQHSLGPALFGKPPRHRWLASIFCLLAIVTAAYYWRGSFLASALLEMDCFSVALGVLCALSGRFSIHAKGIISGFTVVRWDQLEGWEWEKPSRVLLLWVPFSTVYLLPLRKSVCRRSRETKTKELEDLLQRFAPERYRPFSADQPPERTSHG
jgi:hypothetical protein